MINTTMVRDSAALQEAVVPANPQAQTYVQQYNYQSVDPAGRDKQKTQTFSDIVLETLHVCIAVISILFLVFLFYAGIIVVFDKFYEIVYRK